MQFSIYKGAIGKIHKSVRQLVTPLKRLEKAENKEMVELGLYGVFEGYEFNI